MTRQSGGAEPGVWKAAKASVTGAAHLREGRPNQDACAVRAGAAAVVAIADGHGSARYPHSARGAELACAVAQEIGDEWLARELALAPDLARDVVARWRERVRQESEDQEAFGTTLVFAALAASRSLFFQLGDGDLLVIDDAGELHGPLEADPLLLGTSTTSLISEDAWEHARVAIVDDAYRPRVVVATTDGVSSSFSSGDGIARFVRGVERLVSATEPPLVEERLRSVLEHYTSGGSGDDVTVVVAWRDGG